MAISGLSTISDLTTTSLAVGVTQTTLTSSKTRIADDIKNSNPVQTLPTEIGELPKERKSHLGKLQTSMGFVLNEKLSDQMVMVIKNRKTGELIRLVPSEKQLKIKNQMAVSTGLLFDQII